MKEPIARWGILSLLIMIFLAFPLEKLSSGARRSSGTLASSESQDSPGQGTVLYVSTVGNDAWSGKLTLPNTDRSDGPLRSFRGARNAIRTIKAAGPLTQPITVLVEGGTYELPETLVFTTEDSGTEKCPITYAAYRGEAVTLSGGRAITDWKPAQLPGHEQLWQAEIPAAKEGRWNFHELFVDGHRRQRARTPSSGFFHVEGDVTPSDHAAFEFREGDVRPAWAAQGDAELVLLQAWTVSRLYITAVDEPHRTVTLSGRQVAYGQEHNARYWVENTLDGLDSPGEWYLDRRAGVLYYWPMPGEDMARVAVVAPVLEVLVQLTGDIWGGSRPGEAAFGVTPVHDIRMRGLTFSYTDWSIPSGGYTDVQSGFDLRAAVEGAGASSCALENCAFKHLGQFGVEFGKGCKNNQIVGNEMADLGAGGVKVGEPKDANYIDEHTSGTLVANNRIHDIGLVDPGAVGIWVGETSGNTLAHNEIYDTFHMGISVGWTWGYLPTAAHDNIIEFNHVHDVGRGMLGDEGCFYLLGVQPGTVVRNNVCHDVTRYGGSYGGWGIYLDEGSSHILVENNVVYRTQDGGFHQHYGQNNTVHNNIFALGRNAQMRRSINERGMSFTFDHNIVFWENGKLLDGKWSDDNFKMDNNVYFRAEDASGHSPSFDSLPLAEWQRRGHDIHSVVGDPLFVDPDKGDFNLRKGSPALSLGFKPIDVTTVGPQKTE